MSKRDNSQFLEKYIPIADAVAETFGSRCEVVLHDLTRPQSSVVYTKNNHVTGRSVGESFRHLLYQVLPSSKFRNDHLSNYRTTTPDGRIIKSTTALIRDEEGTTIGAFCINFDVDDLLKSTYFLDELITMDEMESVKEEREIVGNIWDVVTDLIQHAIDEYPVPVPDMSKYDKLKIVSFLSDKGLFLIKGAIDELAVHLNVSKVTIYGYLDELKPRSQGV